MHVRDYCADEKKQHVVHLFPLTRLTCIILKQVKSYVMLYIPYGECKLSSEAGGRVQDEGDRRLMMCVCAVPDRLLVLLVLFTVDDLYPTFPGSRTP